MSATRQTTIAWLIAAAVGLTACAATNQVTTGFGDAPQPLLPIPIRVQPCVDRTGTHVTDLAAQATAEFIQQLEASPEFTVQADGAYMLVCEVTGFLPGNAVKRWVLPGWGATVGQVSAMVQDARTGRIQVISHGDATVGGGGLYSVGAWQYIVPEAVEDIVVRLQAWARGEGGGADGAGQG